MKDCDGANRWRETMTATAPGQWATFSCRRVCLLLRVTAAQALRAAPRVLPQFLITCGPRWSPLSAMAHGAPSRAANMQLTVS